jgi:3,4-dihydroxy 2-butanone 4-phosphate synthase / GTP cyclohydrolase II
LLTNNLTKVVGIRGFRLEILERVPIEVEPNGHNERYLKTKREKLNHVFEKYLGRARETELMKSS